MRAFGVASSAWLFVNGACAEGSDAGTYIPYVFALLAVGSGSSLLFAYFLPRWPAIGLAAGIGAIEFVLIAILDRMDVPLFVVAPIGATLNAVAIAYFRLILRPNRSDSRDLRFRRFLLPGGWPESAGAIASPREQAARLYVAVAAATGGVVGTIVTYSFFWDALWDALQPIHLFVTAILTMTYLTLIGPLREYAVGRLEIPGGHHQRTHQGDFPDINILLWQGSRSIIRFVLTWLLVVSLHLCYVSLEQCVSRGEKETIYVMLISGLVPGVASYYWSAALQLGVPSVRARTTTPAVYLATLLGAGLVVTRLTGLFNPDGIIWRGALDGWPTYLRGGVVILLSLVISIVAVGPPIVGGGWALDRFRHTRPMIALATCIVIAALIGTGFANLLVDAVTNQSMTIKDIPLIAIRSAFASAFWAVGLWSSGFPQLVMHHRMRNRHGIAQSSATPSTAPDPCYPVVREIPPRRD